jgi:hypothetical protein
VAASELRQGFAKRVPEERWEELGATEGKVGGVAAPNASPPLNRHGGGWWLVLQGPRIVGQRGSKEIPPFLFHRSLSPFFRDSNLIPSGYDTIPFNEDLGAPRPGLWGLSPLPMFMWVPPCRWAPLQNLLEPSRYNTEKSQTCSGGQNRTSHI